MLPHRPLMRLPIVLHFLPFAAASVVRISSDYLVKEEIEAPRGWLKTGRPAPDTRISLRIALPRANAHILESHLNEISDPNHERYGKHLSKEEIDALAGPPDSLSVVKDWLYSLNFDDEEIKPSPSNELLQLTTTICKAEKMLDTVFHEWTHSESDVTRVRTTSWSIPHNLHDHVRFIQPTTMFESIHIPPSITGTTEHAVDLETRQSEDRDPCEEELSISCIQKLYGLSGYTPLANINNTIAVASFLSVPANHEDLQTFYAEQRPDAVGTDSDFKEVLINGAQNKQDGTSDEGEHLYPESNLDTQWAFGLSYPIPATFLSTGGEGSKTIPDGLQTDISLPLDIWIDYLLNQPEIPWVISISWEVREQTLPREYAESLCEGFMKLALRGVSVIFASGDFGVGDGDVYESSQRCWSNDSERKHKFIPMFPSSCPWITSVGMTMSYDGEEVGGWVPGGGPKASVGAGPRIVSGSGFSEYFPRPKWQDDAVLKYLSQMPKGQYDGLFTREGRAYPDVAVQGVSAPTYVIGKRKVVSGTSVSAPIFAAVIALVNDARLRNGQSTLGFLNPFLYSKGVDGMNDILEGESYGCGTDGFSAAPGWDPVTGLGSPNFPKLKDIALAWGAKET